MSTEREFEDLQFSCRVLLLIHTFCRIDHLQNLSKLKMNYYDIIVKTFSY